MKRTILTLITLFLSLILIIGVWAQDTISVRGEPRTPDNQIDLMYGLDTYDENGARIEGLEENINNDEGYFEVIGLRAPTGEMDPKTIWVQGTCMLHTFSITKQENQFVIMDAHESEKLIQKSMSNNIDLGVLKEDKSVYIKVNSDVPVTFLVEDLNGVWIAENGAYKKEQGTFGNVEPRTQYRITLVSDEDEKWTKVITTGDDCEGTRVIKRKNYFEVENFPGNIFPKIGFFKKIGLFFKGLFS